MVDRKKIVEFVRSIRTDRRAVRGLGANLGFALGQGQGRPAVEAYGAAIGNPSDASTDEAFVSGYLACARDLTTGFVQGANELAATDPVRLARWVESKTGALDIVRLARKKSIIRLADVNDTLGHAQEAQWSRVMKELRTERLLEPVLGANARERPQALTLLGVKVLEAVELGLLRATDAVDSADADLALRIDQLSTTPSDWNEAGLKKAFAGVGRGREVSMCTRVLSLLPPTHVERFCRALYGLNLYWCAESMLRAGALSGSYSGELATAILCSVADRVRDPFQVTVDQARRALAASPDGERFLTMNRAQLVNYALCASPIQPWFETWRELFSRPDHWEVPVEAVSMIEDPDSLQSWTAANAIKRGAPLSDEVTKAVITAMQHGDKDVRWRAAYILGSFPSLEACAALEKYAHHDSFRWVPRGATRSLLEMLLLSERDDERDAIARALRKFVLPPHKNEAQKFALVELARSVGIAGAMKVERAKTFSTYTLMAGSALVEAQSCSAAN